MSPPDDPVLLRRARIALWAAWGQRCGYGLYGLAIAGFAWGLARGYSELSSTLIVWALVLGSTFLAPAIVMSHAVKAAEREERRAGGGGR